MGGKTRRSYRSRRGKPIHVGPPYGNRILCCDGERCSVSVCSGSKTDLHSQTRVERSLASVGGGCHLRCMSVAQLQEEISKLTAGEKLALADYLRIQTEVSARSPGELALLAEPALAKDWNRAEEDAAWQHLQPAR